MFSFLEETLLREYFLFCAVLGEFAPPKQLFTYLAKAFSVATRRANALFELTEQESVKEIVTEADANRYKRIVQYLQESGKPTLYDTQTNALIIIKSEAIVIATQADMCLDVNATQNKVYQVLLSRAGCGQVDALRILGVLQLNGLFVKKDMAEGRANLVKGAEWGDVISMFLLVKSGVTYSHVIRNFYEATRNTPYSILFDIAEQCRDDRSTGEVEVLLLNELFNRKLVQKNIYSPSHACVLYATGISREEKERILLSENKQLLSDIVNLPIYRPIDELTCQVDGIKTTPLRREDEQRQIVTALQNRDLRTWSKYKPMCLCTNSAYVQKMYAKALERCFSDEIVARIYVNELQERDFEQTSNNIFVRSCKCVSNDQQTVKRQNDTNNVFLIFLNGDIADSVLKHVKEFLSTAWRRQVRLVHPAITLDFSYTLPICICDSVNAKKLKNIVETVRIADVDSQETSKVIEEMLSKKAYAYFGRSVEITDNPTKLLSDFSLEAIEEIINTAFCAQRVKFTCEDNIAFAIKPFVDSYAQQHAERSYGFGGYNK